MIGASTYPVSTERASVRSGLWIGIGLAVVAVALWLMAGVASALPSDDGTWPAPEGGVTVSISAGLQHTCAVRSSDPYPGQAWCWGDNSQGQAVFRPETFVQVSAGNFHTCGLVADGRVTCWGGGPAMFQPAPGGLYRKVSAGSENTCAVTASRFAAVVGAKRPSA